MLVHNLTVKHATALTADRRQAAATRLRKHTQWVSEGLGPGAAVQPSHLRQLLDGLRLAWRLPLRAKHKEVLWRACLNGLFLPALQRHGAAGQQGSGCLCTQPGAGVPGRRHVFWDCAAAQSVRAVIATQLTAPLSVEQLWLGTVPAGVHAGVWAAVRLAAFNAMWKARLHLAGLSTPAAQQHLTAVVPVADQVVGAAGHLAVQWFWAFLREFAAAESAPHWWRRRVGAAHPFLHFPHPAAGLTVREQ